MAVLSSQPARPRARRRAPVYPRSLLAAAGLALCAVGCPRDPQLAGTPPMEFAPTDGGSPGEPRPTGSSVAGPATDPSAGATASTSTSTATAAATAAPAAAGLSAVLGPDGAEFPSSQAGSLTVTIRNDGAESATLRMDILGSGILSLDVFDAQGKRVPTIPPSMPLTPADMERAKETLLPGQSRKVTYTLHLFSPQLPPGEYTVQMRGMPSNRARFLIRPSR